MSLSTWKLEFSSNILSMVVAHAADHYLHEIYLPDVVVRFSLNLGSNPVGSQSVLVSLSTIIFIIFWDFLMFYPIVLSPKVKRRAIITYKYGIYELFHELPNNLRLKILGNYGISGKCLNPIEW